MGNPPSGDDRTMTIREPRTPLARIADPITGAHAGALRHGIDGDEQGVGVGAAGDDADRTAVQARIGRFLARCEEAIGVEVKPRSRTRHASAL